MALRREVERLREALATALQIPPRPTYRAPILCRDLERWSVSVQSNGATAPTTVVAAVPVGPPPLPPSLDDLETVEQHVAMLRTLLKISAPAGKPYHTLFDQPRFQAIQAKLREANLLAERLVNQVERSRNQKDLLWHLMVAQRNDEINRKRR
jgi:hypothetical protein